MKYLIISFVILLVFSCEQPTKQGAAQQPENCFPIVIIESEKDTIEIGETFEAKVYLSDTSYFYLTDPVTGKKQSVYPVYRINGELKESPDGYYYLYEEVVSNQPVYREFPNLREVEFGILMPHPDSLGGAIEFSKVYTYVAVD